MSFYRIEALPLDQALKIQQPPPPPQEAPNPDVDDTDPPEPTLLCGSPIVCDYGQVLQKPACLKIFEVIFGGLICILTLAVLIYRIEEEGKQFLCRGSFIAFYVMVSCCLLEAIVFLCLYVAVKNSKKNRRLRVWVKTFDFAAAIIYLISFVIYFYILIKWDFRSLDDTNENVEYLTEMIITLILAFFNAIFYFVIVCFR